MSLLFLDNCKLDIVYFVMYCIAIIFVLLEGGLFELDYLIVDFVYSILEFLEFYGFTLGVILG